MKTFTYNVLTARGLITLSIKTSDKAEADNAIYWFTHNGIDYNVYDQKGEIVK